MSCSPYKGGQYYTYSQNHLSSIKFFLYENGSYESYSFTEGSKRLLEKGKWIASGNKVIITIDTFYGMNNNPSVINIENKYKRRCLNRNELFMKKRIDGKLYKTVLKSK
jgi:hypothetical protein